MNVINTNGEYEYNAGTKTLMTSDNAVYRARIELALSKGSWLYAPFSGHNLSRFDRDRQSAAKVEEYRKELTLYLKKYSPDVVKTLVDRTKAEFDLLIRKEQNANG